MTIAAIIAALSEPGCPLDRYFAGRPLLVQTIAHAALSARIARIAVITDDPVCARLAHGAGATVVSAAGTRHADAAAAQGAKVLAREGDAPADLCVILDPRRPVRTPEMINSALEHLARRGGDCLVSVHAACEPLWVADEDGFGRLAETDAAPRGGRSRFAENRSIVVTRSVRLVEWGQPLGGDTVLHEIPRTCALRLQSEDDWCAAEALYRRLWAGRAGALLATIRLLVFDFDGVMTDNRVFVSEDGREAVLCSRGDGMGLDLLRASGLPIAVISKEGNPVVSARCRKLKVPCVQGVGDKLPVLHRFVEEHGIGFDAVAFMGNDLNDLECMRAAAVAIAPADAHPAVLREADVVTAAAGGLGAVREIADLLIAARKTQAP